MGCFQVQRLRRGEGGDVADVDVLQVVPVQGPLGRPPWPGGPGVGGGRSLTFLVCSSSSTVWGWGVDTCPSFRDF